MKRTLPIIVAAIVLASSPVTAKQETPWIEKVALIAVNEGGCRAPREDKAMQIAIGSAMIEGALTKDVVIARARKRAHAIADDIARTRTQNTFCAAFMYYLDKGYPR
ncbi:hypothetical protein [Mesorhizobium sp. M1E.F.Ca.ET.063.01.1.1]|uniref:hypothetical protein n=1 Tax=Mesorhizobium sp. M1E.F.Ca.ET.063.01.1.1 TaxID=2496750 RepID=UPI000FCBC5DF|nr:hypothetical protein [Mesorhizobium sp. M1E.F.Ca.ET.063.01.1.1]RUW85308.1 hypothetical protein EOA29_05435 [Mesorhizobium sp. M1E.F.Ca.ET.063.01.1.1]